MQQNEVLFTNVIAGSPVTLTATLPDRSVATTITFP